MGASRFMRDYVTLVNKLDSYFDGQVIIIDGGDDMQQIGFAVRPSSGPYSGGKFYFKMHLMDNYPKTAPVVVCHTKIYHPNIDSEIDVNDNFTNICVSLLDEDWQENCSLVDVVQAVLFLFHQPNMEDALSTYFSGSYEEEEQFDIQVRKSLMGETIDGWIEFDPNFEEIQETNVDVTVKDLGVDVTTDTICGNVNEGHAATNGATNIQENDVKPVKDDVANDVRTEMVATFDDLCLEIKSTFRHYTHMLQLWFGFLKYFAWVSVVMGAQAVKGTNNIFKR